MSRGESNEAKQYEREDAVHAGAGNVDEQDGKIRFTKALLYIRDCTQCMVH
jgi:hypothetical protein